MNDPLYDPEVLRKLCARMPKIDFRVHPKPPTPLSTERLAELARAMQNDSRVIGLGGEALNDQLAQAGYVRTFGLL